MTADCCLVSYGDLITVSLNCGCLEWIRARDSDMLKIKIPIDTTLVTAATAASRQYFQVQDNKVNPSLIKLGGNGFCIRVFT